LVGGALLLFDSHAGSRIQRASSSAVCRQL